MKIPINHAGPATPSSRRRFLKQAAGTAAAFAAPNIITGPLFGAAAPSNRINVGQIGCGSIADYYHFSNLKQMDDVRVVATCDAFKSRGKTMAAKYNKHYGAEIATAHDDFREILARPDVDAVIIAAHDNWHTPMSIAAAKAGKVVYCQKPLALDFSLTGLLRKVIHEKQRVFQFGTQYRSGGPNGRYRRMVQLVRKRSARSKWASAAIPSATCPTLRPEPGGRSHGIPKRKKLSATPRPPRCSPARRARNGASGEP